MKRRCAVLSLLAGATTGPLLAAPLAPTVRLGASAALSGPAARLGLRYHAGARAAIEFANQHGGVRGALVQMDLRDD
jgi:ABC-type branched-subunit amino acid transport system substrate-binding protein